MKRYFMVWVFVIALCVTITNGKTVSADTSVSGYISADTTWTSANSPYVVTGNIVVKSGVTLTIEPGVTVKVDSGKSIQVDGALIAKGTSASKITFTKNSSSNWGYILFSDSSTDAAYDTSGNYTSGSILEYCVVEYAGGASVSDNGAVRMNNAHPLINYCTIKNNSASGIYAYNLTGTLKIKNNTISNNTSSSSGGGIYCSSSRSTTVTISGNTISNNTASSSGGGIYSYSDYSNYSSTVTISGNTISNNTASSSGGGIYSYSSTVTISGNTISNNTSLSSGGGIYSYSYSATISGNTISNNTASSSGGGIYSYTDYSSVTISGNTISNNTASSSGGGIYSYTGNISGNTVSNNTSSSSGGGIYSEKGTVTKNSLTRNFAKNASAVYFINGSSKDFTYNTIMGNKATDSSNTYSVYISSNPTFNYNNIFSNTATYELWNGNSYGSSNLDAKNNWWGTTDDSSVQGKIYDWIDDSTKGTVDYATFETDIRTDCPISPPTGFTATAGSGQIILGWTANSESDAKGYKVYWDTDSGHSYANTADAGNVTSYTITGLADSKYYVTVTAYDATYSSASDDTGTVVNENQANGNESGYAEEKTAILSNDTTPPTVSATSPASGATGVALNTTISATFSETMDTSTITTSTFTLSGGITGTVSYNDTSKTSTFTPSANLSYSTTYTATITTGVKDAVGNAMSSNYSWSFTATAAPDTTAPASGSVNINSGNSYTNSTTVTLTLSATDNVGVTGYYISDSSTTPSASASGWTSVTSTTSYSASVSYTLSSGEGGKTVYAWFKDSSGNISSAANDSITLDTTVPTVTISSPTSNSTYTSTSSTISLGGSASDSVSGISSVAWSNNKGGNGTAAGTASWTASSISLSSGDNIITVTAKDGAGNSGTDTITVTYSTGTTVSVPMVSTGSASSVTTSSATLNGTVNANGASTTAWFNYGITSGNYTGTSTTQSVSGSSNTTVSIGISGLSSNTTYYYRIAASNSGGTAYGSEAYFTTSSTAVTPTPTPTSTPTSTDGLVAYYPFNGNANDESGNGNHGTVNGATLTTDRLGNANSAYSFDGANDYIKINWSENFRSNNFTISSWVKIDTDSTDSDMILAIPSHSNWDDAWHFDYRCNLNRLEGYVYSSHWFEEYKEIKGAFHFVCLVKDQDAGRLYVDDNIIKTENGLDVNLDYGSPRGILIGADDDSNNDGVADVHWFKGIIDSVRIYNRALSESEILELYNEGGSTTPTPTPTPTTTPMPTITPIGGRGIILGFVFDEEEDPLRGVSVTVSGNSYSANTETDENGYYEFTDLASGKYTLTYQKDDYETQSQEISLEEDETVEADSVIMEEIKNGTIYGYAVDIYGEPIESVKLKLKGSRTKKMKKAASDANGFFEFTDLDADTYVIFARKRFYKMAKQTVKLEEGESKEIEIEMRKTKKRIKGLLLEEDVQ